MNQATSPSPGLVSRRLAVFDLDGTLVDTLDDLTASGNRLLARLGRPAVTPEVIRPMVGDGVPALVRRILAHAEVAVDEAAAIGEFGRDYAANAANASRCFPGVPEMLSLLRARGWRLAVCTNKPEQAARTLLEALGLAPLLSAIGGGDSFATRKPDPGHLLGTIRAAGGVPEGSILVGDHANDVAAAHGTGIGCIFALWGYGTRAMAEGCAASAETVGQVPGLAEKLLTA